MGINWQTELKIKRAGADLAVKCEEEIAAFKAQHSEAGAALDMLEAGIKTVLRDAGEDAARAICVGELKAFGEAVIGAEKLRTWI